MTMTIHERLDAEAKRLRAEQAAGDNRSSDSFINGFERAALIAYRLERFDAIDRTTIMTADGRFPATSLPEPDADREPTTVPGTVTVTLTRDDANRIFQAMANEQARIFSLDVEQDAIDHTIELAEKTRQWALSMAEPIEGTEGQQCGHPSDQTALGGGLLVCHACGQVIGHSPRGQS